MKLTEDRLMLIEEVAVEARVVLSTVRYWISVGKLYSVKPGRRRLVPRSAFEEFMQKKTPQLPESTEPENGTRTPQAKTTMAALQKVVAILQPLTEDERARVLRATVTLLGQKIDH